MSPRRAGILAAPPHKLGKFPLTSRYLIGVSGGRDSVALLHCLVETGYRDLVICHLDHQLRSRISRTDAQFVESLAKNYGLAADIDKTNVRALATQKKISIETAGRIARYEFFSQAAKRRNTRTIFLAHHADDLVETFLINLFRGAGTTGLAGMREITTRRIGDVALTIARPLLAVWRDEIDRYVKTNDLKFREDASNRDLTPLRNRIRHRVIPFLEKTLGRNIRASIWRGATITAEEESFFDELLPERLTELEAKQVRVMPLTLQRRTLRDWLRMHRVPNVNFALVERVRDLVELTSRVAKTNLPGDRHVRRRAGKIFIE